MKKWGLREYLGGATLLALFCGAWVWTVVLINGVGSQFLHREAETVAKTWHAHVKSQISVYRKLTGRTPLSADETWMIRIATSDVVSRFVVFNPAGGVLIDSREASGIEVDRRQDPLHASRPFAQKLEDGLQVSLSSNGIGRDITASADIPLRVAGQIVSIARLELQIDRAASRIDGAMTGLTIAISCTFALMLILIIAALRHATRAQIQSRAEVERISRRDVVSGLPNRVLLEEIIQRNASSRNPQTAVILIAIDRFNKLAEQEGAQTLNALVQSMAMRLRQRLRPEDTVIRLSTSEFVVLSPGGSADGAVSTATRLRDVANEVYAVRGRQFSVTISAGIAMMPEHGLTEDLLIKSARIARNRAVANGLPLLVFSEEMASTERANAALEADLREALEVGGLHVAYQPQHDLASNSVHGFEALCRWTHPQWGDISPGRFIPLAEESDLIGPLGEFVLNEACRQAMTWPDPLKVSVNLSPLQFMRQNVVDVVMTALRTSGLPPRRLELEITESTLMQDTKAILDALLTLKRLGISIAMDDFGTGYSSLGYLAKFPFSKIKLDRSFIIDLEEKREAVAIVSGVALMGRSLGMRINAEGVETEAQLAKLREIGVDEIQGYIYGRPLDRLEAEAHIRAHHGGRGGAQRAA